MTENDEVSEVGSPLQAASTLHDLARLAGCSTATASRALRDDPRINEQTKDRIWQLAHEYDFPLAKYLGLRKTSTKQVSIVIPRLPSRTTSLREPFLLELVAHIGDEARAYGVDIALLTLAPSNETELVEVFQAVGSGGVIVLGQGTLHEALNRLGERRRDFVVWGARMERQTYCSVGSDNFGGGYKAAHHHIQTGRKHLMFIGDTQGPEMSQRYDGFIKAASDHGMETTLAECRLDLDAASAVIERALSTGQQFDALVCVNDVVGIGAVNTLHKHGYTVPRDVGVIGYDDIDYCRFVRPTLSTISQNVIRSARLLLSKVIAGDCSVEDSEMLSTDLILRGT